LGLSNTQLDGAHLVHAHMASLALPVLASTSATILQWLYRYRLLIRYLSSSSSQSFICTTLLQINYSAVMVGEIIYCAVMVSG